MLRLLCALGVVCVVLIPTASEAGRKLLPSPDPQPNGAYLSCLGMDRGACYDLRETFYTTNTQLEHVADRLLLRSGGSGFMETEDSYVPVAWTSEGKTIRLLVDDERTPRMYALDGPFLEGAKGSLFIFIRSESEYEDTEGGAIDIP